ncbi:MAG: tyrosine-type recombinase/integrase [Synergistaceae bacterium]|nr:tyrosine-type recombinase/integrase [Synergistaceae bacterium]
MEVDAIRSIEEISEMRAFLRKKNMGHELLFVMGINTALRIGDLLSLSIGDVVGESGEIMKAICLKEQKTGKRKLVPVNESLKNALSGYLVEYPHRDHSAPLFTSKKGGVLSRSQAWRILKAAGESAGLSNIGTHSLRKTFGYHAYKKPARI